MGGRAPQKVTDLRQGGGVMRFTKRSTQTPTTKCPTPSAKDSRRRLVAQASGLRPRSGPL